MIAPNSVILEVGRERCGAAAGTIAALLRPERLRDLDDKEIQKVLAVIKQVYGKIVEEAQFRHMKEAESVPQAKELK